MIWRAPQQLESQQSSPPEQYLSSTADVVEALFANQANTASAAAAVSGGDLMEEDSPSQQARTA